MSASPSRFIELGLTEGISTRVNELGIEIPTPIQEQAIPVVLEGRDVLGLAQTGTGKTAAYLLPLLQRITENSSSGPRRAKALILTPTRELAHQVATSIRDFSRGMAIRYVVICGGERYSGQIDALKKGVDIIVATPGRFEDLFAKGVLDLDTVQHLILDEADQMIDLGFYPAIRRICNAITSEHQTIFFSATMPDEMRRLVDEFLTDSITIRIPSKNVAADTVRQKAVMLSGPMKRPYLTKLIEDAKEEQVLVFAGTKRMADQLSSFLVAEGYSVDVLHGDMRQMIRTKVLRKFKSGELQVLVATDVAARGIDVTGLNLVINFDLPQTPELYVHRIGRTGRAKKTGMAISLCAPSQRRQLVAITRHIKNTMEIVNAIGESVSLQDMKDPGKPAPGRGWPFRSKGRNSKPGSFKAGSSKPGSSKPGSSKPGSSKSGQARSAHPKSGKPNPDHYRSDHYRSDHANPDQPGPDRTRPDHAKAGPSRNGGSKKQAPRRNKPDNAPRGFYVEPDTPPADRPVKKKDKSRKPKWSSKKKADARRNRERQNAARKPA